MSSDNFEGFARLVGQSRGEQLDRLLARVYAASAAGELADDDVCRLDGMIRARRAAGREPVVPRRRSRARKPEWVERRRVLAGGAFMPDKLRSGFTEGERAVLAVVAADVKKAGRCMAFVAELAARAGVSETTVRNALREAVRLGLIVVHERRVTAMRNLSNVISVVSPFWLDWLRRFAGGGGCKWLHPYGERNKKEAFGESVGPLFSVPARASRPPERLARGLR